MVATQPSDAGAGSTVRTLASNRTSFAPGGLAEIMLRNSLREIFLSGICT